MTIAKTLRAVIILSAAVTMPALAQGSPAHHGRVRNLRDFRSAYDQLGVTYPVRGVENVYGFSGRDPSRPGGWDPSLHPSGS